MTSRERFLWGGLGATLPILLTIAFADAKMIAHYVNTDHVELIAYCVRTLALFGLGGLWVFLHKSETEPLKAVQLGIVAPAVITAMVNASNVQDLRKGEAETAWNPPSMGLIASAQAAPLAMTLHDPVTAQTKDKKEKSLMDRIIKGLLGR